MSRSAARMLAAGLAAGGCVCLIMLAFRIDAGEVVLLGIGMGCLVIATWINSVTGHASSKRESGNPSDEATGVIS